METLGNRDDLGETAAGLGNPGGVWRNCGRLSEKCGGLWVNCGALCGGLQMTREFCRYCGIFGLTLAKLRGLWEILELCGGIAGYYR